MKRILVAYDNGAQAANALETSIALAKGFSAEIYLVAVYSAYEWDNSSTATPDSTPAELQDFYEQIRVYLEKSLADTADKVRQQGVTAYTEVWLGAPGEVIIEVAERLNVDLIAMGTHNRGTVGRLFMGSVSNYVLHHAECPVLIAKD